MPGAMRPLSQVQVPGQKGHQEAGTRQAESQETAKTESMKQVKKRLMRSYFPNLLQLEKREPEIENQELELRLEEQEKELEI